MKNSGKAAGASSRKKKQEKARAKTGDRARTDAPTDGTVPAASTQASLPADDTDLVLELTPAQLRQLEALLAEARKLGAKGEDSDLILEALAQLAEHRTRAARETRAGRREGRKKKSIRD